MFTIRTTREDDWRLLRAFRIENATDNAISWTATREETLRMPEESWRMRARRGEADDTTSLVATESGTGRWLGMMCAQSGDADGPEPVLTGVYVTPDARGRAHGVTDALLERVRDWATPRGPILRLYVYEHAEPARRFYARNGFTPTGRTRPMQVLGREPEPGDGAVLELIRPLPSHV